jgi:hypothetical protein
VLIEGEIRDQALQPPVLVLELLHTAHLHDAHPGVLLLPGAEGRLGIMCVFQVVWVYYGLLIASRPVIGWNILAVLINCLTVGAYFRFAHREGGQSEGGRAAQ